MKQSLATALLSIALAVIPLCTRQPAVAQSGSGAVLKVMTLNVWHGLRSGESRKRFPGEDPERFEKRFAWQIEELKRLDPDFLLFQEVNPNQRLSRRYAEALGYDEIHKVTSCGLHLGAIYKIPKNVNDGIAILAKPEFQLRRVGKKRLSGNAMCSATWGFQTRESRYALFGEITVGDRQVLLATAHLASPAFTPADFDEQIERMVQAGDLTTEQRNEILGERDRKLDRNTTEARRLLEEISKHRARMAHPDQALPVIMGGDCNAGLDKPGLRLVLEAGFTDVASGPDFLTWDPVTNAENYSIGTRRHYSLPTFGKPEVEAMLDQRHDTPRQIDHIFITQQIEVESAKMVMNQPKDGIYPSDHFAILATLRLP